MFYEAIIDDINAIDSEIEGIKYCAVDENEYGNTDLKTIQVYIFNEKTRPLVEEHVELRYMKVVD